MPLPSVDLNLKFISNFQLSSWRSDSGMVQNQITYPALDFNNNDVSKIIWIRSSFVIIFSIYFIHISSWDSTTISTHHYPVDSSQTTQTDIVCPNHVLVRFRQSSSMGHTVQNGKSRTCMTYGVLKSTIWTIKSLTEV